MDMFYGGLEFAYAMWLAAGPILFLVILWKIKNYFSFLLRSAHTLQAGVVKGMENSIFLISKEMDVLKMDVATVKRDILRVEALAVKFSKEIQDKIKKIKTDFEKIEKQINSAVEKIGKAIKNVKSTLDKVKIPMPKPFHDISLGFIFNPLLDLIPNIGLDKLTQSIKGELRDIRLAVQDLEKFIDLEEKLFEAMVDDIKKSVEDLKGIEKRVSDIIEKQIIYSINEGFKGWKEGFEKNNFGARYLYILSIVLFGGAYLAWVYSAWTTAFMLVTNGGI